MAELHPHALFAGSFDPPTLGHYDLIQRGVELFGSLRVVIASNSSKKGMFSVDQRLDLLRQDLADLPVIIDTCSGLLVDYAQQHGVSVLLRGVRTVTDFEYEYPMALTNRQLDDSIETVFVMPNAKYSYISSRLIQEVYANGGTLEKFLSANVHQQLLSRK
ncbi:MAG: pantetheine-phosphate adenylyltransferase [Planctomycetes bacterium]|nr:pantetheine-phosphate adenylyltransferase [Planctomycetota bacterium]